VERGEWNFFESKIRQKKPKKKEIKQQRRYATSRSISSHSPSAIRSLELLLRSVSTELEDGHVVRIRVAAARDIVLLLALALVVLLVVVPLPMLLLLLVVIVVVPLPVAVLLLLLVVALLLLLPLPAELLLLLLLPPLVLLPLPLARLGLQHHFIHTFRGVFLDMKICKVRE
jgi:hypothetical protein